MDKGREYLRHKLAKEGKGVLSLGMFKCLGYENKGGGQK